MTCDGARPEDLATKWAVSGKTLREAAKDVPAGRREPRKELVSHARTGPARQEKVRADIVTNKRSVAHIVSDLIGSPVAIPDARKPEAQGGLPDEPGFYAWWTTSGAIPGVPEAPHPSEEELDLFYIGISPRDANSSRSIRARVLKDHIGGNIGSSTFRKTLAALLREELDLHPRETTTRIVLPKADNDRLSAWQRRHLRLTWALTAEPWSTEDEVIKAMSPPVNLASNSSHPFYSTLSSARKGLGEAVRRGRAGSP
jgi:hypothetical protein